MLSGFRTDYSGRAGVALRTGIAARVHPLGDPLRYSWGLEYRTPEELARIVEQLPGKKVVVLHPDESADNHYGYVERGARADVVGVVESARLTADGAEVEIRFDGEGGPAAIRRGIRDLSLGYHCDVDPSGFQRNTAVDHLAMVPRGRCRGKGGACAITGDCGCDSGESVAPDAPSNSGESKGIRHESETVQGCSCNSLAKSLDSGQPAMHMPVGNTNAEQQEKALMDEMNKQLAAAHAEAAAQKARADQAEKDRDAQKIRADQAEKDLETAKLEAHNARKDAETSQGKIDAEKARADQAEKDAADKVAKADADAKTLIEKSRTDAAADLDKQVIAKVALVAEATPIIGQNDKGEKVNVVSMSPREIHAAVVLRVDGDDLEKMDPKPSDDFVAGVYKGAVGRYNRAASSRAETRTAIEQTRVDTTTVVTTTVTGGSGNAEEQAMERERARLANQIPTLTDTKDKE